MKFSKYINYVPSAVEALKFYESAFGFTIEYIHESETYGELNTGETILGFATHEKASQNVLGNSKLEFIHSELQFVTNDVTSFFERAIQAGGIPLKEPVQKPSGQTTALLKGIDGAIIELISQ